MKKILILLAFLQLIHYSYGQFVATDNYVDVNTTRFYNDASGSTPIPTAFNTNGTTQNEYRYLVSTMRLANRLKEVFNSFVVPTSSFYTSTFPSSPSNPTGLFTIVKTALDNGYTTMPSESFNFDLNKNKLHAVYVRPTAIVTGGRPIVLLTNGNQEDFKTQWAGTLFIAADLVMRGYAVLIYENFTVSNKFTSLPLYLNSPGVYSGSFGLDEAHFNALTALTMVHLGVAAEQMVIGQNTSLNLNADVNRMYAVGASEGARSSLVLGYADDANNFNDNVNYFATSPNRTITQFNNWGGFNAKSRWVDPTNYQNRIRAFIGWGTNMPEMPITYVRNLYDAGDVNCPALFIHAVNDNSQRIDITPPIGTATVYSYGPGNFTNTPTNKLTSNLSAFNIRFHVYVNCAALGEHSWFEQYGQGLAPHYANVVTNTNANISTAYNNAVVNNMLTDIYPRMEEYAYIGLQMLSTGKIMGNFLNRATSTTNPLVSNVSFYIAPQINRSASPSGPDGDYFGALTLPHYPDGKFVSSALCSTLTIPYTSPVIYNPTTFITAGRHAAPIPSPLSDEKKLTIKGFNMYPNPTSNEFMVEANNMESDYNITVYNMIGEIVYSQNNIARENQLVKVNTNTLANGIYKVIIENKESKINKSIVVQH
ncbi:MAG: hypothetical protein JWN78_2465 [Bacteroidota bacterium]|nr:hypothetical protein [Bacteroidota bacterium]